MPVSDRAVRRYSTLLATYRRRTSGLLVALWDRLDRHDRVDAAEYARLAEPALDGAKVAAVAASAAFFSLALEVPPVGVRPERVEVEARILDPFLAAWHALKEGRPLIEALAAGRSQADAVGSDFVTRTARRTGDVVADLSGVKVRWRRVPEPGACAWCREVAGNHYRTAESADFGHDRCGCDVVPA